MENEVPARMQMVLGWLGTKVQVVFAPVNATGCWHSHGEKLQGNPWHRGVWLCVVGRGADGASGL